MRWNDLYIAATGMALGHEESTAKAASDGRYPADEHEANGFLSVCVAPEGPAVDLGVRAAKTALARAGDKADPVDLTIHAHVFHQGFDEVSPSAYLREHTLGSDGLAMEVGQACNGGMAALDIAATYLTARPEMSAALLTTADRFVPPAYDRYRTIGGQLLGDGGTAALLCRGSGVARLLSSASVGDSRFNDVLLGDLPWTNVSGENGWPIDIQSRAEGYGARHGAQIFVDMVESTKRCESQAMERALTEAELDAGDIDWWVLPTQGLSQVDWDTRKAFGIDIARTTWELGRRCGHLGAGDQFAGLTHLLETKQVRPGDHVLLHGVGANFMFSSAVVEITAELPDETPQEKGGASR